MVKRKKGKRKKEKGERKKEKGKRKKGKGKGRWSIEKYKIEIGNGELIRFLSPDIRACGHLARPGGFSMDFVQVEALFASRCGVSRKKRNEELRKIGEKTSALLNVHTP